MDLTIQGFAYVQRKARGHHVELPSGRVHEDLSSEGFDWRQTIEVRFVVEHEDSRPDRSAAETGRPWKYAATVLTGNWKAGMSVLRGDFRFIYG